jgi:RNA polymerase sigma-70 factor (ECF subfamily)
MDRLRAENRRARRSEIKAALDIADQLPGPAEEVEARFAFAAFARAFREMPERRRAILSASRLEGLTHQMIAKRFGISKRTVQYELERAIAHLEARLEENDPADCTFEGPKSS